MKTYNFKQHELGQDQELAIKNAIDNWAIMTHTERTAFIDSINVYTNPDWLETRAGKFTASTACEFLSDPASKAAKESGEIGESAKSLCYRVMSEQNGWRESQNPYMEFAQVRRGLVFEPTARKLAEKELGETITECGFVESDTMFGCSPDGLIMDGDKVKAVIEIKCPEPKAFYKQLMDCAKREYQLQMQFAMNICDCPRAFFILYCPEVSPKVFILKYTRGIQWQNKINERKKQVADFMHQVNEQINSGEFNIETLE
jgi:hypothetical protein